MQVCNPLPHCVVNISTRSQVLGNSRIENAQCYGYWRGGGVREFLWARAVIIWVYNTPATAWTPFPSPVPQHPETSSGGFRGHGLDGVFIFVGPGMGYMGT